MERAPQAPAEPARGRRVPVVESAERLGLARLLRPLHDRGRASLVVLGYHRVLPFSSPSDYPLDPELVSATPDDFDWQMAYVRERMSPVSLRQVIAALDGGPPLPPNAVAVTIDDGFTDTFRYAWPILRRHGIEATVFVPTDNVEKGQPFWFELAAHLMMRAEPGTIVVEETGHRLPVGASLAERRCSIQLIHECLKSLPDERRLDLVDGWESALGTHLDPSTFELIRPLRWDEIRAMAAGGLDFGSHTVSHPNLRQVSDVALDWELRESRRVLCERLQRDVASVCYPIGTRSSFDERVMRAARSAGYGLGLGYLQGANWQDRICRFGLQRLNVSVSTSRSYFRALLQLPDWVSWRAFPDA